MNLIVFSKNRAYQLDAFLRSAIENAKLKSEQISVLYKYDSEFIESLNILKIEHKNVKFIEENDFHQQTLDLLKNSDNFVSFATDDALFTREVNQQNIFAALSLDEVVCYSLRLGFNLNFCYPLNKDQKIPNGQIVESNFYFNWKLSDSDWGYPMSVDGHFFRKEFLLNYLPNLPFKTPNTLELCMTHIPKLTHTNDFMASGIFSHYFNVPINVVQKDFNNRHGNISVNDLNQAYMNGLRYDVKKIYQFMNNSAHQEIDIFNG